MNQLNTKKPADNPNKRLNQLSDIVDSETKKILDDLDTVSSDFDGVIAILTDRVIQSTDPAFVIALARLQELRMDTIKKRIDIVKAVVTDKANEINVKKKSPVSDLDAIMSGAAFGAALGAKITGGDTLQPMKERGFETVEADSVEIIETEYLGPSVEQDVSNIIDSE